LDLIFNPAKHEFRSGAMDSQKSESFQLANSQYEERHPIDLYERDACALICMVDKNGEVTHGNVKRTIEGLARMGHRSGFIDGEGDGVGILTDIPRQLWAKRLTKAGLRSSLATSPNFWVAHLMIPAHAQEHSSQLIDKICREIVDAGLQVLFDGAGKVNHHVLGQSAKNNVPLFWQIVGIGGQIPRKQLDGTLFNLQVRLESELDVHFPSFSTYSVVYKVQGTVEILRRYYPELRDPDYASMVTLGHARYSTNTNSIFERVQPFGLLGHNGEFNTISRLRMEAAMLGIDLITGNSDSQDVDRVIQSLCANHGLDLIEAMELAFPPYDHDLIQDSPELQRMYQKMRQSFGHFAQGPAAVVARLGDLCVFSVDALGLRPLWFGETEKECFATSERGVYPLDGMASSPKPLAPGEKIALKIRPGRAIQILSYPDIQKHIFRHVHGNSPLQVQNKKEGENWRFWSPTAQVPQMLGRTSGNEEQPTHQAGSAQEQGTVTAEAEITFVEEFPWSTTETTIDTKTMAALGWERYHVSMINMMAVDKKEPIGSLGWDAPLAAMSKTRVNIADFFKETVAVVTNPAIDREREQAQFSTEVIIGERPPIGLSNQDDTFLIELDMPLLLGGYSPLGDSEIMQEIATNHGTRTIEELLSIFGNRAHIISMSADLNESIEEAIQRLQEEAITAASNGTKCLFLDDTDALSGKRIWLDPILATAAIDKALRDTESDSNLRRQTGIVVRSGALRNLHDLVLCISLGANAVLPYALYATALGIAPKSNNKVIAVEEVFDCLSSLITTLNKGIEKVISTVGCHELRGYGHSFSSIGLCKGIAAIFGTPNYFGSDKGGLSWSDLDTDANIRAAELRGEEKNKLANPNRLYPKVWKKVEALALGEMFAEEYAQNLVEAEHKLPVAIRNILGLRENEPPIDMENVDLSIGNHSMPLFISAMSFGSQGELPYRIYAEAAYHLNIFCVNGEGGELPELMGKYPRNRGQQIASGRFGVNIELLNSCNLLEIKIGQGAKPGEGGHLPGFKVSEQVAKARSTTPGVTLISPSNNHDLYSIEDLAQLIDELKTANPKSRVSVKMPVVPGIGIIAVGVAKAGADVISLSGFDGGTGAARAHALRHVGLPVEIGIWLAHRELIASGLRDDVEIWSDGGMRSGHDVIKMMCLGANRVGFGTMTMVAIGCTICRGCQDGTCHTGITTHIKTVEEATAKGLKSFKPRKYQSSINRIANVFCAISSEISEITARLGFVRTQDLVGRADLLEQVQMHNMIDLSPLLHCAPPPPEKQPQPGGRRLTRPRNTLSKQITQIVTEHVGRGDTEMTYDDEQVMAMDRALGTHLSGAFQRGANLRADAVGAIHLSFSNSAIPGNGLAAFVDDPVDVLVEGGAQDGVGKCARGGMVTILKGLNHNGKRLDGSVGKSFAYGAQAGFFIVQGDADTRACVRLSGADVIFGGEIREPLRDQDGGIGARANLKGYAFEYMTSGRVLVLGDPGPWICAGMTGGAIYQRVQTNMGLTLDAIRKRIAKGATVGIFQLDEHDTIAVSEMLEIYIQTLETNNQVKASEHLHSVLKMPQDHFVKITPVG
jgi:glutamate synthase (NADPH) large chain